MWEGELGWVREFARDLDARPALPDAGPEELEKHAGQIAHLQDIFSLVASLSPEKRPDVKAWDEVVAPLWRRLFAKGDDVDRYILGDLWSSILLDAGETERATRALVGVVASARNFYLFEEGLERCREIRRLCASEPGVPLAQLVNVEGSIHFLMGDPEAAEGSYNEALALAASIKEEDFPFWIGATKSDFLAQEQFNLIESWFERAERSPLVQRESLAVKAENMVSEVEALPLSQGFKHFRAVAAAQLAILRRDFSKARAALLRLGEKGGVVEGPYQYPLYTIRCRLESRICQLEEDWDGAYAWLRGALKEGLRNAFPTEEQLVLSQALVVIKGLGAFHHPRPEAGLVADMVQLLEDKDWYTGRSHSRSVGELARKVGEAINQNGGPELNITRLHMAGLLHDIGKLRCPWSLLNKIGPITPRERVLLHQHSEHGADILRTIGMSDIAAVVEQHHETMNGAGYPKGITPQPMGAVVAVCDVYEASVTPNRRYKEPKTPPAIIEELKTLAGTLYWRPAVEALARI